MVVGESGDRFTFLVMVAAVVAGEDGVVRDSMHGEWREKEVGRGVGERCGEREEMWGSGREIWWSGVYGNMLDGSPWMK